MPIETLPESTTRTLSSSLVLNDAKSVVKELVDNALDARATAISVEISANTLDVIQVKDNGTGIDVQDRQLLCRRGWTSKIRTTDDLAQLGGTFLGFRGEALASIVELSQAVGVTTRVDGEVTGTAIKYVVPGMISSSSTSHPVGTTIRVQDFLTKIPVRKQTALKTATRTLEAIKSLLFAFAFARPEVRFSLKVLKGKSDKLNWTYAASSSQSMTEIVTKIVGKEVSSICTPHTISPDDCDANIGSSWSVNAVLISVTADPSKVRNATQYISVDGRPVNMERHPMKQIAKSYKRHVQKNVLSDTAYSVSRPFLFMQIRCPSASYDVNVEPAKDEVLFLDSRADQLLSLVECLFTRAYPQANVNEEEITAKGRERLSRDDVSIFDKIMLRKESDHVDGAAVRSGTGQDMEPPGDMASRKESFRNPWTITAMNAIVQPKKTNAIEASTSYETSTSADSNIQNEEMSEEVHSITGRRLGSSLNLGGEYISSLTLNTSPPASPRPGPPMRRRAKGSTDAEDEDLVPQVPNSSNPPALSRQTGLQTWLTPDIEVRGTVGLGTPSSSIVGAVSMPKSTTSVTRIPIITPREYHTMPSGSNIGRRREGRQRPFKVPSKRRSQGQLTADFPLTPPSSVHDRHEQTPQKVLRGTPTRLESDEDVPMSLSSSQHRLPGPNPELNDIMAFEHRKKAVIAQQRRLATRFPPTSHFFGGSAQPEMGGESSFGTVDKGPGEGSIIEDYGARFGGEERISSKSRSNQIQTHSLEAAKDLSHSHPEEATGPTVDTIEPGCVRDPSIVTIPEKPAFSPSDPRIYFIRQQRKPSHGKLHRTKSSKLPLENIVPRFATFDLKVTTAILHDLERIRNFAQRLSSIDMYLQRGQIGYNNLNSTDVTTNPDWAATLHRLLTTKYQEDAPDGQDPGPDLPTLHFRTL